MTTPSSAGAAPLSVVVLSHRAEIRDAIANAVGRRPAPDLPRLSFRDATSAGDVLGYIDAGEVDLAVLDGEAQPTGGMGVCRQLKNESDDPPPIIVVVRRPDDHWLATWSQADAVLVHPLDPIRAAETVAAVLRARAGVAAPATRTAPGRG